MWKQGGPTGHLEKGFTLHPCFCPYFLTRLSACTARYPGLAQLVHNSYTNPSTYGTLASLMESLQVRVLGTATNSAAATLEERVQAELGKTEWETYTPCCRLVPSTHTCLKRRQERELPTSTAPLKNFCPEQHESVRSQSGTAQAKPVATHLELRAPAAGRHDGVLPWPAPGPLASLPVLNLLLMFPGDTAPISFEKPCLQTLLWLQCPPSAPKRFPLL